MDHRIIASPANCPAAAPPKERRKEEAALEAKGTIAENSFGRDALLTSAATTEDAAVAGRKGLQLEQRLVDVLKKLPGLGNREAGLKKLMRFGSVKMAGVGFVLSAVDLKLSWKRSSKLERTIGASATALSGGALAATLASALGKAPALASKALPLTGVAGTVFAGLGALRAFKDPTQSSGQRGMALSSAVLQGLGTGLMFTPLAPVGVGLIAVGVVQGLLGGWLGKKPAVNGVFKSLGVPGARVPAKA